MKKYFLVAAIAAFTLSCKEKKEVENNTTNMSDSTATDPMAAPVNPMPQDTGNMTADSASTSNMRKDSMK
ncbi:MULTISPECIES: hypothetical protein [Chryseobacterium]|uniref:Cytochrome C551 n=1 Tax=Chryseobacterium caseinilyticum TaxID=2771428 RepID=A0ABR8Z7T9_9FLAO|nr:MULTISPECIES: hypothetical protein [Chryseobacterium]KQS92302.1 hypothetical protein ASG21_07615 [Chryseobacterium sp. Leaf394]MBD8081362.1 hypothetical protein [Chryseobacterium caseinilyticum]